MLGVRRRMRRGVQYEGLVWRSDSMGHKMEVLKVQRVRPQILTTCLVGHASSKTRP